MERTLGPHARQTLRGWQATLRSVLACCVVLAAGCGGPSVEPGSDAGPDVEPRGDMGMGPVSDHGVTTPPYEVLPLTCRGTPPACGGASGDRAECDDIAGCDYGYCRFRSLACIAGSRSYCESGCDWDGYYCSRQSNGCRATSAASCTSVAACEWTSSRADLLFGDVPCQGTPRACSTFNGATCGTQPGCSMGCSTGRVECNGACVDTLRDGNHCGECGSSCGANSECVAGVCRCANPDFTRDLCGVCDANPENDCVVDCAGVPGGNAVEDRCGVCDANPANDCDCAGVPAGPNVVDMCGTCDAIAGNDCTQDCEGAWGGAARVDDCGVCDADPTNDCDCMNVPGGPARLDQCGVCDEDTTNDCAIDCSGVWGGPDRLDMCGVCDADATNDCVQDCAGAWGGVATLDMCAVCDADATNDCVQDCLGEWGGARALDNCGTCDADPTNDCVCLGAVCPASGPCFEGYCDPSTDTCAERALADGAACGGADTTICVATACVQRGCGDAFLEPGPAPAREACDDGNVASGDLCSASCTASSLRLDPSSGSVRAQIAPVAVDGAGRHLIAWIRDPYHPYLYARRFDALGVPIDTIAIEVETSQYVTEPTVTGLAGGGWVVTYAASSTNGNYNVVFRMVASDGAVGPTRVVSSRVGQNRTPVVVAVGTGFVVVWSVYNVWDGMDNGLVARRFSATGTSLSNEFSVRTPGGISYSEHRVASQGNTWFVVWESIDVSGMPPRIRGRFFSLGTALGAEFVVDAGASPTVAALGNDEWAVGYSERISPYRVHVRRIPRTAPLSQPPEFVGWRANNASIAVTVAPYGQSILAGYRNANGDYVIATVGPTALDAADATTARADLATSLWGFVLSPSPLGTWVVAPQPGSPYSWLSVALIRRP